MDIRNVLGALIDGTNRIIAELGSIIYRPIGGLFSSYANLLKECSNIFNHIASFGVFVFVPRIKAVLPTTPIAGKTVKEEGGVFGGIVEGLSLQPYITYSINLIRRLQPSSKVVDSAGARIIESSRPSSRLTEVFDEIARYSVPIIQATSQLTESRTSAPTSTKARELPVQPVGDKELTAPIMVVAESFSSLKRGLEGFGYPPLSRKEERENIEVTPQMSSFSDIIKTGTMVRVNLLSNIAYDTAVSSHSLKKPSTFGGYPQASRLSEYKMAFDEPYVYRPILSDIFLNQEYIKTPLLAEIAGKVSEQYIIQASPPSIRGQYGPTVIPYGRSGESLRYSAIYPSSLLLSFFALSLPFVLQAIKSPQYKEPSVPPASISSSMSPSTYSMISSSVYYPVREMLNVVHDFQTIMSSNIPTFSLFDWVKGDFLQQYVSARKVEQGSAHLAFEDVLENVSGNIKVNASKWNEELVMKTLMMLDGAFMKELQIVRAGNLSPLTTLSSEYARTLRTFRIAEEQAQRESDMVAIPATIEPPMSSLTPSSFRREVQNVFNITVPEGADIDLRELERKITQILNEQVRRYYGSLT